VKYANLLSAEQKAWLADYAKRQAANGGAYVDFATTALRERYDLKAQIRVRGRLVHLSSVVGAYLRAIGGTRKRSRPTVLPRTPVGPRW